MCRCTTLTHLSSDLICGKSNLVSVSCERAAPALNCKGSSSARHNRDAWKVTRLRRASDASRIPGAAAVGDRPTTLRFERYRISLSALPSFSSSAPGGNSYVDERQESRAFVHSRLEPRETRANEAEKRDFRVLVYVYDNAAAFPIVIVVSENNKNKTRAGKDRRAWRRGEGGQAEFSKFARNVTFWPCFEEARERARAIWPRWIRESTKLSESGRRGKKGPKRKVRERKSDVLA